MWLRKLTRDNSLIMVLTSAFDHVFWGLFLMLSLSNKEIKKTKQPAVIQESWQKQTWQPIFWFVQSFPSLFCCSYTPKQINKKIIVAWSFTNLPEHVFAQFFFFSLSLPSLSVSFSLRHRTHSRCYTSCRGTGLLHGAPETQQDSKREASSQSDNVT